MELLGLTMGSENSTLMFTIATGSYERMFRQCIRSQERYARRFGHSFVCIDVQPGRQTANQAAWLKIPMLMTALNSGFSKVAFIDADCEIRDHAPNWTDLVRTHSIGMAKGKSGRLNSGVIFAKSDNVAKGFLSKLIKNSDLAVPEEDGAPYENGHVIHYAKSLNSLIILDHALWNNNSVLDPKSYIQHFSGGPLREHYNANCLSLTEKIASQWMPKLTSRFSNRSHKAETVHYTNQDYMNYAMPYYVAKYKNVFSSGWAAS